MAVHDFHAYTLLALSALSLYYDNNAIFSERIPTFFTLSYFAVDLMDCVIRKDGVFVIHALLALGICASCNASSLHHDVLRTVSRGAWVELSTPALHRWYATKKKRDYALYFGLFTACRMIWIPRLLFKIQQACTNRWLWMLGACLYILQIAWYVNMIKIFWRYDEEMAKGSSDNTNGNQEEEFKSQIDLLFGHSQKDEAKSSK